MGNSPKNFPTNPIFLPQIPKQCANLPAASPNNRSLAALLGASPGASVSAHIALQIIQTCFPENLRTTEGHARMKAMIPTFDLDLASPAATADHARRSAQIDALLQLHHPSSTNQFPAPFTPQALPPPDEARQT
jgi:hypothetical protein